MRAFITILLFVIFCQDVDAQNNLQLQYGYRGSVAGAKFLPSTFDLGNKYLQFGFNFKAWVSNRSLNYYSIKTIRNKGELTSTDLSSFIDQLDTKNIIGVGQDLNLIGIGYKTRFWNKPINFSFAITDRMSAAVTYPKQLAQLAWEGNKQFEGQRIQLSTTINGRYFREYSFGTAFRIFKSRELKVRVGAALKYYQGLLAIDSENTSLFFETGMGGDFVEIDYDYEVFVTGEEDFSLFRSKGYGVGGSAGITAKYKDRISFDVGLSDLGSIEYTKDTKKYVDKGNIYFSGLGRGDVENIDVYVDSLAAIFETEVLDNQRFRMPVGMRLQMQLTYHFINDLEETNPGNVFFTYIQGFDELPGVTKNARYTLGYNQRVWRFLYMGINASYGGFNDLTFGGLISSRIGKTRFGIHSDDFTGFIFPKLGTGAGLGLIFQVYL